MYNKELKESFIKQLDSAGISENYKRNFIILLERSEKIEKELNKDLYDFSLEETIMFLKNLRSKSVKSMDTRKSMVVMYRKWAFQQETTQNIHITRDIEELRSENLINVIAEKNKYITKKDLYDWVIELTNARDSIIILLLWWGIKGLDFKEIRYLKESDIDIANKTIKLKNRKIQVDDFTIDMIRRCMNEYGYFCFSKGMGIRYNSFAESEYLIKNVAITKKDKERFYKEPASKQIVQRIVRENRDLIDNSYINVTTVFKSGQYYRFKIRYGEQAKQIIEKRKLFKNKNRKINDNDLDFVRNFLIKEGESVSNPSKASVFLSEYERYLEIYEKDKAALDEL
ncbi:hypothetical protein OR62_14375 (plasmid) [Clostridium tetani]|uniref:MrpR N-terminal core-binding domain-containing protein n=1 Tax=Clostridium tetani TaxID=1513 RepID=A0ABY0ETL1_CLOTA|nr:hypothetical protein [Clostridium tetani]KHO31402.1 hypothetical protein OR62_14375 [Clostridium tetani]RXI57289.1 hypothetical protein DP131_05355 [Clostridium tetani]RXI74344.1 hypothetical protein DQN76_00515 [Clostridium tetani]